MTETLSNNAGILGWIKANWLFLLFLAAIVTVFIVFRSSPSELASTTELDALLTDGSPTVLEFYSNF